MGAGMEAFHAAQDAVWPRFAVFPLPFAPGYAKMTQMSCKGPCAVRAGSGGIMGETGPQGTETGGTRCQSGTLTHATPPPRRKNSKGRVKDYE